MSVLEPKPASRKRSLFALLAIASAGLIYLALAPKNKSQPASPPTGQREMQPFGPPIPTGDLPPEQVTCIRNLQHIGAALGYWATRHEGSFPFNVGTNHGGTLEYCIRDKSGFDSNAFIHLRTLTNDEELASPSVLLCPRDKSKTPATNFTSVTAQNVSYLLRSGTNVTRASGSEVLLLCPVHDQIIECNGTVLINVPREKIRGASKP